MAASSQKPPVTTSGGNLQPSAVETPCDHDVDPPGDLEADRILRYQQDPAQVDPLQEQPNPQDSHDGYDGETPDDEDDNDQMRSLSDPLQDQLEMQTIAVRDLGPAEGQHVGHRDAPNQRVFQVPDPFLFLDQVPTPAPANRCAARESGGVPALVITQAGEVSTDALPDGS